jgi:hypothetical protein
MEQERKEVFSRIFKNYYMVTLEELANQLIDMDTDLNGAISNANKILNTTYFPGEYNEGCFSMDNTLRATVVMCIYDVFDPCGEKKRAKTEAKDSANDDNDEDNEICDSEDLMAYAFIRPNFLGVCTKTGEILSIPIGNGEDDTVPQTENSVYVRDFFDAIMIAMLNDNVEYDAPVFVRSDTGCWRSIVDVNAFDKQYLESVGLDRAIIELQLR